MGHQALSSRNDLGAAFLDASFAEFKERLENLFLPNLSFPELYFGAFLALYECRSMLAAQIRR